MLIAKWGNSFAVRIPADVLKALGLKEGDDINFCTLDDGRVAVISERQQRRAAIDRLKSFRGSLPADYVFDREEANAR